MGQNLPGLDTEENIEEAQQQDADMDAYEHALGLEPDEVEQEVIELEDGSVAVNFQPKEGPRKNPEFYAFYRSLEDYRNSFKNKSDVMVLEPSSDFLKYMKSSGATGAKAKR